MREILRRIHFTTQLSDAEKIRFSTLWDRVQTDPQYASMLLELRTLEAKYDTVLSKLSAKDQDAICDYVSLCEGMSWRALEFACQMMVFKYE